MCDDTMGTNVDVLTIDDLRPAPYNPRRIEQTAADGLQTSMARFGDLSGIVWNQRSGCLVAGHQRVAQLRELGAVMVDGALCVSVQGEVRRFPVRVVDWGEVDEKAANVAANNQAIAGVFTDDLGPLLREIQAGIGDEEFERLRMDALLDHDALKGLGGDVDEDEAPEPPAEPVTKPGDLLVLGRHRLLCGDSTKADDVARLLGGAEVDLMLTDPPYGIGEAAGKNKSRGGVVGGVGSGGRYVPPRDYGDKAWDDAPVPWPSLEALVALGKKSAVFGGNYYPVPPSPSWLVWDKETNGDFADAELAWTNYGTAARLKRHMWNGMLRVDREERHHPTQKPVAVIAWVIGLCPGEPKTILDPFLGSGTTLIAAEQLGRTCYGLEISPAYCDVIVKRWEALTGEEARHG
jgi:site-specific DNA-methyltransferase (adenine-specific)/modification methylase